MKQIIILLSITLFFWSCSAEKEEEKETKPASTKDINSYFTDTKDIKTLPPEGEYIEKYSNGVIKIHGYIAGGMRHGQWASFYPAGDLWSEVFYVSGKRNGRTTSYYENGKKRYDGFYKDDAEAGKWTYWEESGKLAQEIDYSKEKK